MTSSKIILTRLLGLSLLWGCQPGDPPFMKKNLDGGNATFTGSIFIGGNEQSDSEAFLTITIDSLQSYSFSIYRWFESSGYIQGESLYSKFRSNDTIWLKDEVSNTVTLDRGPGDALGPVLTNDDFGYSYADQQSENSYYIHLEADMVKGDSEPIRVIIIGIVAKKS